MNDHPLAAGRSLHLEQRTGAHATPRPLYETPPLRLIPDALSVAGRVKGANAMPEKKLTENTPATSADELAELLLYVWLRSEVKDDFDLPLAITN